MSDPKERIRKAQNMLSEGLITQEQFRQIQQQVLQEMGLLSNPNLGRAQNRATRKRRYFGSYEIFESIGHGGMGAVYRARHREPSVAQMQGGDVAIKLLHARYTKDQMFRKRFEREAQLSINIEHPYVVRAFELVQAKNYLGLVMELIKGKPLSDLIGTVVGPIPWPKAQIYFNQILEGVGFAHSMGVVHRDLKPENIMILPDNTVKIFDFGIAKDFNNKGITTNMVMGTVNYMAPEQHHNAKNVDHRADIYALGMTLYEMVAGRLPWAEDASYLNIVRLKEHQNFPLPTHFYPHIPDYVVATISQSLHPDISARISSIETFRNRLNVAIQPTHTQRPTPPPEPPRAAPAAQPKPTPRPKPTPQPYDGHSPMAQPSSKEDGILLKIITPLVLTIAVVMLIINQSSAPPEQPLARNSTSDSEGVGYHSPEQDGEEGDYQLETNTRTKTKTRTKYKKSKKDVTTKIEDDPHWFEHTWKENCAKDPTESCLDKDIDERCNKRNKSKVSQEQCKEKLHKMVRDRIEELEYEANTNYFAADHELFLKYKKLCKEEPKIGTCNTSYVCQDFPETDENRKCKAFVTKDSAYKPSRTKKQEYKECAKTVFSCDKKAMLKELCKEHYIKGDYEECTKDLLSAKGIFSTSPKLEFIDKCRKDKTTYCMEEIKRECKQLPRSERKGCERDYHEALSRRPYANKIKDFYSKQFDREWEKKCSKGNDKYKPNCLNEFISRICQNHTLGIFSLSEYVSTCQRFLQKQVIIRNNKAKKLE